MARTNRITVQTSQHTTHEGAPAARITPEQELRRSVMACLLFENTFYESGVEIAVRIAELVAKVPAEKVAAIAIEARSVMYLRHAPLWLVRAMAATGGGKLVGDTLAHVIQRPDELAEFLSLYWGGNKRTQPLSKQVKRGLALALRKFDAYQLAKWDQNSAAIKLRDVLFLTHPKAQDEAQQTLWNQLASKTLATPDTWETQLSAGKDKRETFTRMLAEKKLGGLALLRNLRNMTEAGVDRQLVINAIAEHPFPKVLPFRFIAAAKYVPDLEPVLEQAMLRAASTLEKLPGKSAIVVDHSGSMDSAVSAKSEITRFEAASALAVLLREICDDVVVVTFGQTAALVPARRGFALVDAMRAAHVGHSTMTELGKQLADRQGYNRIIIITDEQSHTKLSAPLEFSHGYVINTASYQNGIGYGAWNHIDGWSEHIVRWISLFEHTLDETLQELVP